MTIDPEGGEKLLSGPMPDITPPQIVAMVIAGIPILATLLRAFGVYDLSIEQEKALTDAVTWASVLGASLIGGDALLRTGRNLRKGQVEAALVSDPALDPSRVQVTDSVIQQPIAPVSTVAPPPATPPPPGTTIT